LWTEQGMPGKNAESLTAFLEGGGRMGALMRSRDWTASPLGQPADWPDTLKAAIGTCLSSQFPMVIWWGPQLLMFYNDAWQPILGDKKHPSGLGRPGAESWPETWPIVGVQFENALKGVASWSEDLLLASDRRGFLEECYFTYSHSPLKDASGQVVGVCSVVSETTSRVLTTRRLRVLHDLSAATIEATSEHNSLEAVCERLLGLLCLDNPDVPFAALYVNDTDTSVHLAGAVGIDAELLPVLVGVDTRDRWGVSETLRTRTPAKIDASSWVPGLPGVTWPEPTTQLVSLPLAQSTRLLDPCGVLVVGVNARARLDESYQDFLTLVAAQLASAVSALQTLESERKARADVEQSARLKDEFLALLAHELRNPLAPIRTAVALMKTPGATESDLARGRDVIDRQVAHMARLLDDLLDVSRLSRGELSLRRTLVPFREVMTAAMEVSLPLIEKKSQVVDLKGIDDSLHFDGDPARLTQVFGNLLNNAAKFSPSRSTIEVSARRDGSDVLVAVRDSGIGVAPDMLDSIFGLFTQGSGVGDTSSGGLGIGLAIARRLVTLHGGDIRAESDGPGKGSTFIVRLPATLPPAADPAVKPEAPSDGVAARVVVADDNVDAADTLAMLLAKLGCNVRTVYGGELAVREAKVFEPDVVFLDLGLPDLDGYEACRQIRAEPGGKRITLVALTGWGRAQDRERTKNAGFDHHLVKPVEVERLLQLVRSRPSA
jgi:signal transduction histidine kinase